MSWEGSKTDWTPDDGFDNENLNRIEGNIQDNHDKREGFDIGDCVIGSTSSKLAVYIDDSWTKIFELTIGFSGNIKVEFNLRCPDYGDTYGMIYKNGSLAASTVRYPAPGLNYKTFSKNIYNVKKLDKIQLYIRSGHSSDRAESSFMRIKTDYSPNAW